MRWFMPRSRIALAFALIVVGTSCDSTGPRGTVQGKARFYNGATPGTAGTPANLSVAAAAPFNGTWAVSPDKVTLHLKKIMLLSNGNNGTSADVDCTVEYDKSKPGLTQLADCPFSVDAGTYSGLSLTFGGSEDILINDAVGGFYTTSAGVVTSAPAGGAQALTFSPQGSGGDWTPSLTTFPAPLTVADSTTLTLSVVVNGLHFLWVTVSGGQATLTGSTSPQRPDLVYAIGSLARVEYYVNNQIATTGAYCTTQCSSGNIPLGIKTFGLYYTDASTPTMVGMAYNGYATNCQSLGPAFLTSPKSYIGLDATGNVGWAIPASYDYAAYTAEMRVQRVSALGGTTTLYCKTRSTDPAPAGGSYASGAPAINQAANAIGTYILMGK
jgi:hypothetical protein